MVKKIKKKLKQLSKTSYTYRALYNSLKLLKRKMMYRRIYKKIKVNDKMIIFEAFFAGKYACSPKAIYEYLVNNEEYKDFEFVWAFKNTKKHKWLEKNPRTKIVKYDSKKYYKYYAEAKYWITNSRLPEAIIRKDNQRYIQCWHGTPLKRLGYDIKGKGTNVLSTSKQVRKQYKTDAKRYSYMLSPSKFATEKFISAFNLKGLNKEDIIVEKGYPRNDFLYNYKKDDIERVKEKLDLPKDKKIILYAPTWRDNQHVLGKGYTLDLKMNLENMKKNFGKDYIILLRLHYLLADNLNIEEYKGFAYDVSKYDDVNDLYIISDLLITDYSSVFFDYANLKRPMIFYMYDLEEYKNDTRNFYIDLSELPGPIVKTEKELIKEIKNIESLNKKYKEKYKKFNEKFNYLDDGKASQRVVEECIEVVK